MQSYTFICGCGHSGTSLVANMFASHPQVFIPHVETGVFLVPQDAPRRWRRLLDRAQRQEKPNFVEKTPRHLLHLALIRDLVPGARFVLLVRDGRDVAASFIKRLGSAEAGARRWLAETAITREAGAAPDVHILRYEDLITAPEAALRRVCAFAGLPYADDMLRYHESPRRWFGVETLAKGTGAHGAQHRLLRSWQINQPIFDDRGKWQLLLGPNDRALFVTAPARDLLAHFGYD